MSNNETNQEPVTHQNNNNYNLDKLLENKKIAVIKEIPSTEYRFALICKIECIE